MGLFSSVSDFAKWANPVTAVINTAANVGLGLWQNDQNKKQAERANEMNREMWQAQTAYNTPAAQVQRLKEAGLNPALAYGNGSVANTASSAPVMKMAEIKAPSFDLLGKYYELQNQSLSNQMVAEQTRQILASTEKAKADAAVAREEARTKRYENDLWNTTGVSRSDNAMVKLVARAVKIWRDEFYGRSGDVGTYMGPKLSPVQVTQERRYR